MATTEPSQSESEELRRKLATTEALLTQSREELLAREARLSKAEADAGDAVKGRQAAEEELRKVKGTQQEALDNANESEQKWKNVKKQWDDEKTQWYQERSDLETKLYEVEGEMHELRNGRRQFERDCEARVAERNREMEQKEGDMAELREEVNELRKDYRSLSEDKNDLEKLCANQQRDYEMARDLAEITRSDLSDRNKQIEDLQRTNDEAQSNKDACLQLMQEREQLNKQIEQLYNQIEEQEERDNATGQHLNDARAQLFEVQTESRELKARYDALEDRLDQAHALNARLQAESRGRTNGPGSPRGKGLLFSASPPPASTDVRPPLTTKTSTLEEELNIESDESEDEYERVILCEKTEHAIVVADIEPRAQVAAAKETPKLSSTGSKTSVAIEPRAAQKLPPPALSSPKISRVVTAPKPAILSPLTHIKASADNSITTIPSPLLLKPQRALTVSAAALKAPVISETRVIKTSPFAQLSQLPSLDDPPSVHMWRAIFFAVLLTTYYNISQALLYIAYNRASQSSTFTQGLYFTHRFMGNLPGLTLIQSLWSLIWGFFTHYHAGSYRGEALVKTGWEIKGLVENLAGMKHQAMY